MGRAAVSEAIMAQALAQSLTAFLITDAREADFPIVYANDAFLDLTGYNRKEIYGRNCRFLQGDDRDQPGRETVQRALSRHEPYRVIFRNYRKDGTLFLNELAIAPLRDEKGTVTHFVGSQNKVPYENLALLRDEALALLEQLTAREREVLSMMVDGQGNKSVARSLHISPRTAEKHRQRVLRKMGVGSVATLTQYAIAAEHGAMLSAA